MQVVDGCMVVALHVIGWFFSFSVCLTTAGSFGLSTRIYKVSPEAKEQRGCEHCVLTVPQSWSGAVPCELCSEEGTSISPLVTSSCWRIFLRKVDGVGYGIPFSDPACRSMEACDRSIDVVVRIARNPRDGFGSCQAGG